MFMSISLFLQPDEVSSYHSFLFRCHEGHDLPFIGLISIKIKMGSGIFDMCHEEHHDFASFRSLSVECGKNEF